MCGDYEHEEPCEGRLSRTVPRELGVSSANSSPPNQEWMRPEWNDPVMLTVEGTLSDNDKRVLEELRQLLSILEKLPKDKESYGLIHQDAHGEKLRIDASGRITL